MGRRRHRPTRLPFRRIWGRVAPYLGNNAWHVGVLCAASVLNGLAEATLLYLLIRSATAIAAGHRVVDFSLGPIDSHSVPLSRLFEASGAALALLFVLSSWSAWLVAHIVTNTTSEARKATFFDFVRAPWATQSLEPEGRLQEALTAHTQYIGLGMTQITTGVVGGFNFLALIAAALLIDAPAAGIVFLGVGLVAGILFPVTRLTRRMSRRSLQSASKCAAAVSESVTLAREIKTYNVGSVVIAESDELITTSERSLFWVRFLQKVAPSIYQYLALTLVLVGLIAVYEVSSSAGVASLGAIVLLLVRGLTYAQQVSIAVQQANTIAPYIESVDGLRDRYARAIAAQPQGHSPLRSVETLRMSEMTFGYAPGQPVLRDISFDVRHGEVIGIVGPSGSGKSTLVQLLLRLRDCDSGAYLVNGSPALSYLVDDWCRHFVLVPQDNRLLRGTVLDNIRLHRAGLSDEALIRAARDAHLFDDVASWPTGFQTVIGTGEQDISGGQRQRLGIARALAGGPSVLILDEPTSALDMKSEYLIQQTLQKLRGELTLFIVAHRLSTLSLCDRIMVLEDGRIAAMGSHDQVAEHNTFFSEAQRLSRLPA